MWSSQRRLHAPAVTRLGGALYHPQRISRKSPSRCNPGSKPRIALAAKHPPTLPAAVGSLMEIPDAQCHPFRHRRADGGRPDPAGGDAAGRCLAHAGRATRSAGVGQRARTPAAGQRFAGPAAPDPSDGLLTQRGRNVMTPEQKRLASCFRRGGPPGSWRRPSPPLGIETAQVFRIPCVLPNAAVHTAGVSDHNNSDTYRAALRPAHRAASQTASVRNHERIQSETAMREGLRRVTYARVLRTGSHRTPYRNVTP